MKTATFKTKTPTVRDYVKLVEWSDEDQCYIGSAPPLIGQCCHGKNETAVYKELCQIVSEWIAIYEKDGKPLPAPTANREYSGKFMLRLDPQLHKYLALRHAGWRELEWLCHEETSRKVTLRPSATGMNAATSWRAMHGVLLLVLLMAVSFVPVLRLWPWPWITPLVGYFLVVVAVPSLRASFQPPRFGRITQLGIVTATVIAAVSCVVLIGFQIVSHPDMRAYTHAIPVGSLGGMAAGGVCFAVMNAFLEEFVFRHVLFDAISSQWGSWGAIGASASLFGFAHLHGYPPGTAGTILAGIFGFALGWLRMLTRGIGLPVIAHVAADATIFWILARSTAL